MYRQLSLWELEVNEFGAGDVPGSMRCLVKRPSAFLCFAAAVPAIGVEGWVEGIVVLGIQMFLDDAQGFTEPLKVHDFPGPQEADGVSYIRGIHGQTQDVVVGGAGFFLCCHILHQIRNGIAHGLKHGSRERCSRSSLGPKSQCMIHVIGVKTGSLQLFHGQIPGELVDDGGDHFEVAQLFCTQRSSGNVPLTVFWDGHDTVGFPIHSVSTFERIKKYDENEDAGNVGKPYSIEVRDTERTITIYGIASTRFDIAG